MCREYKLACLKLVLSVATLLRWRTLSGLLSDAQISNQITNQFLSKLAFFKNVYFI